MLQPTSIDSTRTAGWAPLALGFRPFFLLAGVAAVLLLAIWPAVWRGALEAPAYYDAVAWHAHEMLFGYVVAVIAGFLLTAVRNWTGQPTWSGARLGLLVAVWLAGRLLPWVDGVPVTFTIMVDVGFLLLLAASLVTPLWAGKGTINRVFVGLLSVMALINLLSHLQLLGMAGAIGDARRVMVDLVVLLMVLIAGRVLPFFAQNALPGFTATQRKPVEWASFGLMGLIVLADLIPATPLRIAGLLWLVFGALQLVRLSGWFDRRALGLPVLWVLHAGYAWLCVGALLMGLSKLGWFLPSAALHALTVGTIGVMTLGMMARVARGHTGRVIDVSRFTAAAFVVLNVGVVARVFGTAWLPAHYAAWVDLSAALWVLAFLLFTIDYAPMLLRRRIDGKDG